MTGVQTCALPISTLDSSNRSPVDKSTSSKLTKAATHFALDLRYNTGGHFESTELLASILTTTNEITTQSAYADLEFNDLRSDQNGAIKYNREIIGNGSNLNIYQGFVISSSATSPGVTGVFLNCISAVQPWALIGSSIKCWGFATENFTNPRFAWSVNPERKSVV